MSFSPEAELEYGDDERGVGPDGEAGDDADAAGHDAEDGHGQGAGLEAAAAAAVADLHAHRGEERSMGRRKEEEVGQREVSAGEGKTEIRGVRGQIKRKENSEKRDELEIHDLV